MQRNFRNVQLVWDDYHIQRETFIPWSLDPLIPWSLDSLVPWSLGPLINWSIDSLISWSLDALALNKRRILAHVVKTFKYYHGAIKYHQTDVDLTYSNAQNVGNHFHLIQWRATTKQNTAFFSIRALLKGTNYITIK